MLSKCMKISKFLKKYRRYKFLAYRDSLTKVYNRQWLEENIEKIKYKYLYFIDVNDLGKVNKSKGHVEGDNHIIRVVNAIKIMVKNIDSKIVRYGGDEFIIFSNHKLTLKNDHFRSGCSIIYKDVKSAIIRADDNMRG